MKTLIIHPKDKSTSFLDIIYKNIKEKTIITGGKTKYEIRELIESHDRIMLMGHGSSFGLFSMGQFGSDSNYVINPTHVKLLEKKSNVIYIWCNADVFVNHFNLKGFYSGMFISEVGEGYFCGVDNVTQNIVDESNFKFVEIVGESINDNLNNLYKNVVSKYGKLIKTNSVAEYNHQRLYLKE